MKIKKKELDKIKELVFYKKLKRWLKRNPESKEIKLALKGYIQQKAKQMKDDKDLSKQWQDLEEAEVEEAVDK